MTPTRRLAPTVTSLANRTILHLLILGLERAYKKRAYKHVLWDILAIGLSSTKSLPSTIFVFVWVQGFAQSFVATYLMGPGLHMFWKTRRGLSNKTTRESLLVNKEFLLVVWKLTLNLPFSFEEEKQRRFAIKYCKKKIQFQSLRK